MAQGSISRKLEQQALKSIITILPSFSPPLHLGTTVDVSCPKAERDPKLHSKLQPFDPLKKAPGFLRWPQKRQAPMVNSWRLILVVVSMLYSTVMIEMIEYTVYTK